MSRQDTQAAPGKKRVRTIKVVDGHEIEEWIEVDDDGGAWPPRSGMRLLDHDLERVDGPVKVAGRATYTHDVRLPGMLWARLLTSPLPAATVTIDVAPALDVPGVRAAIVLEGERVRFLGQAVAAVAADTPEAAEDGLRAIRAAFEPERWAVDRAQALAEGAPEIEKGGNRKRVQETGDRAAAEAALARCAAVVDATYTLPVQHHAALETHGLVVDPQDGEAVVYASTQFVHGIARQVAPELGLTEADVRVHGEHMGGGFGAKFEIGIEGMAACRLARETGRPIHLMLTRPDEFFLAGNRSGGRQHLVGGATADGKLTALVAEVERHGGLGRGSHPGLPYVYQVENAWCEVGAVLMHTDASRAFRAPGHPQASFAMESWVDEVAYSIGMDPLELRKRNVGPVWQRQLDECARRIGWFEHAHRTAPAPLGDRPAVGIGFAVATWGGGGRPVCEVDVVVARDGSVTASVGSQDLGTGTRTYLAAIVAEVLGLELGDVTPRLGDNRYGNANPSGGSTTAASLAPAVYDAAVKARDALAEKLAGPLSVPRERIAFGGRRVFDAEVPADGVTWQQACGMLGEDGVRARGTWKASLAASGVHGAQAARVEVDPLTGRVKVLRMVCVQDCGLPLNRLALRSQINGGMIQSLSYGLYEERVIDAKLGVALNANLEDYKIAGSLEIPELEVVVDEDDRPVIGVGEPPIIPGQSAIANAVFNATGARVRDLPLTPDKVLMACEAVRSST